MLTYGISPDFRDSVHIILRIYFDNFPPSVDGCSEDLDVYACVVIPSILDIRNVDAPAGVTQEESHTGYLLLPSAVLALIFLPRRIQPAFSLIDREVEICVPTK